jgi:hypothetical protein
MAMPSRNGTFFKNQKTKENNMFTLAQVRKEAAKHKADLFINREHGEAEVWLPKGQLWQSTEASCIVISFGYRGAGVMPQVYSHLIEDMSHGIR